MWGASCRRMAQQLLFARLNAKVQAFLLDKMSGELPMKVLQMMNNYPAIELNRNTMLKQQQPPENNAQL